MNNQRNAIDRITYARDTVIAQFNNVRDQIEQVTFDNDLVDNPRVELNNLETKLAKVIANAEAINKEINATDYDIATICYVCSDCGAYANDRTDNGMCLCDNGCGTMPFDMVVL